MHSRFSTGQFPVALQTFLQEKFCTFIIIEEFPDAVAAEQNPDIFPPSLIRIRHGRRCDLDVGVLGFG
jgi:hypothetical protein